MIDIMISDLIFNNDAQDKLFQMQKFIVKFLYELEMFSVLLF